MKKTNSGSFLENLFPAPREIKSFPGTFSMRRGLYLTVSCGKILSAATEEIWNMLQQMAQDLSIRKMESEEVFFLNLTDSDHFREPESIVHTPSGQDSYFLRISESGVFLRGADAPGFYYGLQTLRQLLQAPDGTLPLLEIRDTPDFEWRAYAPFFGGHSYCKAPGNITAYRRTAEAMAQARLNRIAFEAEAFSCGEELRAFGNFCRERFIEPIPFHPFLCLNHKPVTSFVKASEQEFQEMMEPADRAIRLLNPRYFGIAGDELVMSYDHVRRGSIYRKEELAEHAPHEWLALCLNRMRDYLHRRGVRMVMWADAFLDPAYFRGCGCEMKDFCGGSPDHHARAIDLIPRDILLWDWQYTPALRYASLDYLLSKGFQTVGGVLLGSASERLFPEYAFAKKNPNHLGMISLTWSPNLVDSPVREEEIRNCGTIFWNVGCNTGTSADADTFRNYSQLPNPLEQIPEGENTVLLQGPGERFALCSAGRIYGSLRKEGIGAWNPAMHLYTDLWFQAGAAPGLVFDRASLLLELNGSAKCELFLADSPRSPLSAFRKFGEIRKGDRSAGFEIAAAGKHAFCLWLRISDNEEYDFLRTMKLISRTVRENGTAT